MSNAPVIIQSNPPLSDKDYSISPWKVWHTTEAKQPTRLSERYKAARDEFYWPGALRNFMDNAAQEIKNRIDRDIMDALCLPGSVIRR